jgi:predicted dehydrogenase
MRYLIAGLGSVGRRHLRNLLALGEKDIILYRTHRATLGDEELAGLPVETDLSDALKWKPDAVIVANPTSLHMHVAVPAAEAGCHILLEKPIAESLEQISALQAALKSGGGQLLVGFQYRFHPTLIKAHELIRSGAIGKVLAVHAHWGEYLPDWHPWEDYRQGYAARSDLGGGVILTLTHAFDYLRFMLGDVTALSSFSGHLSPLELDVEDAAEIGMRFADGIIGGLHLNYFQRPPSHRLEIVGTGGTLRWDNADGALQMLRAPADFGSMSSPDHQVITETFSLPKGFERNDLFLAEMRHFKDVARGQAEPRCSLEDGIRSLELALAAIRSSREKRIIEWG